MTDDSLDAFLDAAFWKDSTDAADKILAEHPGIATRSIHAAAMLGDEDAVRRFIERDPANATAKGGRHGSDPLTHLCFSTYLALDPSRSERFVRSATALLDAGADPKTGFFDPNHQPDVSWKSALYGASGVAHHPELTRLLVGRGADPNDGEVVYHTPETLDNRAMKILVESGKLTPDSMALMLARKFDWHDDEGVAWLLDHGANPNQLSRWGGRPMHHALQRGNPLSYFERLLDHGGDPTLATPNVPSIFAAAARMARNDVLDLFERRGFAIPLDGDDAFIAACARADAAAATRISAGDPTVMSRLQSQAPDLLVDFAGADNTNAVRLLLDLGFDVGKARTTPRWRVGETALHVAAWRGRTATAQLLIERGAPLEAKLHSGHTPLDMALLAFVEQSEWTPNEQSIVIAQALIRAGARVDPANLTLAAAICLDRDDDVARLTRMATARERQVALSAAAYNANVKGITTLISLGVNVNDYNAGVLLTATPLHSAVNSGSVDAVKRLVEAGASLDTRDTAYQATPLVWAEWYERESKRGGEARQYAEIAAYLRSQQSS